jgi:hypothetical protein
MKNNTSRKSPTHHSSIALNGLAVPGSGDRDLKKVIEVDGLFCIND